MIHVFPLVILLPRKRSASGGKVIGAGVHIYIYIYIYMFVDEKNI